MAATSPGRWPVSRINLQRRIELRPQQLDLGIGQHALAIRGRISVDQLARIDGQDLLPDRPGKDRARRSERLIGDHRRLDPDHHRPDVGASDRRGLELAPARQQMPRDQALGLPPRLVVLLGVQLDVLLARSANVPVRRSARRSAAGSLPSMTSSMILRGEPPRIGQADRPGIAEVKPTRAAVEAVDHFPRLLAGWPDREREAGLARVPDQLRDGSAVCATSRTDRSTSAC